MFHLCNNCALISLSNKAREIVQNLNLLQKQIQREKNKTINSGSFFNKPFKYNDSSNWNTYLAHADRNIDFRFIQNNQNILILNRNLLELNQGILTTFEVN